MHYNKYKIPSRYGNIKKNRLIQNYIKAIALYDTGVTASYGDELLTLVTCSYHTENGQFVVVAKKMA